MPHARRISLALLAALACAARAQTSQPFREIEQGVEDTSPFGTTRRVFRADLRVPSNFEKVYRVDPSVRFAPGVRAPSNGSGLFARVSGGLVAVYSRGQYQTTRRGTSIDIPTDTVFLIGDPRRLLAPAPMGPASPRSLMQRIETRIGGPLHASQPTDRATHNLLRPAPPDREVRIADSYVVIWEDDQERVRRVATRLDQALAASVRRAEKTGESEVTKWQSGRVAK